MKTKQTKTRKNLKKKINGSVLVFKALESRSAPAALSTRYAMEAAPMQGGDQHLS